MVWIAGCWNSLLKSRNPMNNWCLSRIFGARFGRKDCGLSTCKLWSTQAEGWIHFWMKRLQTLNSYQIFKIINQKPITVDVLFKVYPMVPLSCRFNRPDGTFKLNDFSEDLYGPGISWNNMDRRVDSINNDGHLEWLTRQFGGSLIWDIHKSGFGRAARTRFIRLINTQHEALRAASPFITASLPISLYFVLCNSLFKSLRLRVSKFDFAVY